MEEDCGMAREFAVMFSPPFCTHSLSLTEALRQILNSEEAKPLVLSLRALKKLALVVEKYILYVLSHFSL